MAAIKQAQTEAQQMMQKVMLDLNKELMADLQKKGDKKA